MPDTGDFIRGDRRKSQSLHRAHLAIFYSIADFFVCFATFNLVSEKFHFKRKKSQRFVAPDRSKKIHFKISCAFRLQCSEIGKFCLSRTQSDCRIFRIPPAHKQREKKIRKVLTISASTRCTERNETAKYSVFTAGIRQSLSFTLKFVYSSPAFSFSVSLPFSPFHVCRHIQRVHVFIAFLKISVCFSKKQLGMQLPAEKNSGLQHRVKLSVSFHMGLHGGRTYGRLDGSDVITKPRFLSLTGCQNLLPMVLRAELR